MLAYIYTARFQPQLHPYLLAQKNLERAKEVAKEWANNQKCLKIYSMNALKSNNRDLSAILMILTLLKN